MFACRLSDPRDSKLVYSPARCIIAPYSLPESYGRLPYACRSSTLSPALGTADSMSLPQETRVSHFRGIHLAICGYFPMSARAGTISRARQVACTLHLNPRFEACIFVAVMVNVRTFSPSELYSYQISYARTRPIYSRRPSPRPCVTSVRALGSMLFYRVTRAVAATSSTFCRPDGCPISLFGLLHPLDPLPCYYTTLDAP